MTRLVEADELALLLVETLVRDYGLTPDVLQVTPKGDDAAVTMWTRGERSETTVSRRVSTGAGR